jgi:Na+-transporting NADH:ubiquinone oxidoreductase subunit D
MILGYVVEIPLFIYSIILFVSGVSSNSLLAGLNNDVLAVFLVILANLVAGFWILAGYTIGAYGTKVSHKPMLTTFGVLLTITLLPVGIMTLVGTYTGKDEDTEPKKYNWLRLQYNKYYIILKNGISEQNPIVITVLGICSSLAVTNRVENAIAMGIGVTFVIMASSTLVSLLRNLIPPKVRMVAYMVIISVFTISVQMFLQGFFPTIAASLGAYTGLIITNCIVMGRAEAFAIKNPVRYSVVDGFANGMGYTFVLILVSIVRELLASGSILGIDIFGPNWVDWVVMAIAPGGFFVLGMFAWLIKYLTKQAEE